jgi:flagellar secretion chaperone FliS
MSYGLAKARYTSDAAETVSPARLLTMLYDRLVSDLLLAEDAMVKADPKTTGERLGSAQTILLELHATLDTQAWSGGEALDQLYLWVIAELMRARLANDPNRVAQCRNLLAPLRDAWHQALDGSSAETAVPSSAEATHTADAAVSHRSAPVPASAGMPR